MNLPGQGHYLLQVELHIQLHYWLSKTVDGLHTPDDPLLVSVKLFQFLLHATWTSHPH